MVGERVSPWGPLYLEPYRLLLVVMRLFSNLCYCIRAGRCATDARGASRVLEFSENFRFEVDFGLWFVVFGLGFGGDGGFFGFSDVPVRNLGYLKQLCSCENSMKFRGGQLFQMKIFRADVGQTHVY